MFVGAIDGVIELVRKRVFLDLAVPLIRNELPEPLGKTGQFGRREFGNNGFEFFDTHRRKMAEDPNIFKRAYADTNRWDEKENRIRSFGKFDWAYLPMAGIDAPSLRSDGQS